MFAALGSSIIGVVSAEDTPPPKKEKTDPATPGEKAKRRAEIEAYYTAPIQRLAVVIKSAAMEQLRAEPRLYIEGELSEGATAHPHVGMKLKGSEGSFKPIDEKPGFTLNFDKYSGSERFHGQKKLHLNNGNEDPSFLREWLAGEMGRAAGLPAGRCTHALVSLNGKDKGLYVVREGFTKDFLAAHFGNDTGALFEGHFCKEIDAELQLDSGDESARGSLKEIVAACEVEDPAARWARLTKVLDPEAYALYLAFEQAVDFSDGYDFNLNNYRLYLNQGRLYFILHGMDEVFKNPEASLQRGPKSHLGQAFLGCPQGRALYREKITGIYEKVLRGRDWPVLIEAKAQTVKAALVAAGSRKGKEFAQQAEALKADVLKRIESVGEQLKDWPEPLAFDAQGVAVLSKGWHEENESGEAAALGEDGSALRVTAKDESTASWRCTTQLEPGRYRFEGRARAKSVDALDDEKGRGAGLRISGAPDKRSNALAGDSDWAELKYDFVVSDPREVILVAELRARKGEAWFAREAFRLVRLK